VSVAAARVFVGMLGSLMYIEERSSRRLIRSELMKPN
jgi:hypothetical protein